MDMGKIGAFIAQFDTALSAEAWDRIEAMTERYLGSEDFHSHVGMNLVDRLLPHQETLDLAERVVVKSLEKNTVENLRRLSPEMGNERHQKLEFVRLYSRYAWVLWEKGRTEGASEAARQAMGYVSETGEPGAEDMLRLGIVRYRAGEVEAGWAYVTQALMADTQIEDRDTAYLPAIGGILDGKYSARQDPRAFVSDYRSRHAEAAPDLTLVTLEGERIELRQQKGKVHLLVFFSPLCGSCRQEISQMKTLCETFAARGDAAIIFVLNQPDRKQGALDLFAESGIRSPTIVVLEAGSAYDLISEEPATWIVDPAGKIVAKHTGYSPGDERVYRREIDRLLRVE